MHGQTGRMRLQEAQRPGSRDLSMGALVTRRLMHRLGRRPPAEHEADYYAHTVRDQPVAHT